MAKETEKTKTKKTDKKKSTKPKTSSNAKKQAPVDPETAARRAAKQEEIRQMQEKRRSSKRVRDIISGLIYIAIGVFLFVSIQFRVGGKFGNQLGIFLEGMFGHIGLVLPWYMILVGLLFVFGKALHFSNRTFAVSVGLLLLFTVLNAARFIDPNNLFFDIGTFYDAGTQLKSGGIVGMLVGTLIVRYFGAAGLYIFTLTLIVIGFLLLLNTPLSKALENRRNRKEEERLLDEMYAQEAADFSYREQTGTPVIPADPATDAFPAASQVTADTPVMKAGGKKDARKFAKTIEGHVPSFVDQPPVPEKKTFSQKFNQALSGLDIREKKTGKSNVVDFLSSEDPFGRDGRGGSVGLEEKSEPRQGYGMDGSVTTEGYGLNGDPELPQEGPDVSGGMFGMEKEEPEISVSAPDLGSSAAGSSSDTLKDIWSKPAPSEKTPSKADPAPFDPDPLPFEEGEDQVPELPKSFRRKMAEPARDVISDSDAALGFTAPAPDHRAEEAAAAGAAAGGAVSAAEAAKYKKNFEKAAFDPKEAAAAMAQAENGMKKPVPVHYRKPSIDLLDRPQQVDNSGRAEMLKEKARVLEETLASFNVDARVLRVTQGPAVTRFEVQPGPGVKVSKIVGLSDDIALNLRAKSIRMEAPIPGKAAVGIEVQNEHTQMVRIREIIGCEEFRKAKSKITFAVGKDIAGNNIVADLKSMPHLLIAGSTGSGKSVCINSIIASILYKADPSEVKLVLIDPKVVELGNYNGIPHLLIPVVTDPGKAAAALAWAVAEMTNRYKAFAEHNVRDLASYNKKMRADGMEEQVMPQIVIIIDELADLMMAAPSQVEESITRLAQLARAAGMHLIVATQRPSVDIITGLIKANIPSRIAFAVSSQFDSRTILDMGGAEKLVGKGDMLFNPLGMGKPLRVQGTFISDDEVNRLIDFVKGQDLNVDYSSEVMDTIEQGGPAGYDGDETDELLPEAIETVIDAGKASTSMLQRRFRIGYNRAARIMDMMEDRNVIGPPDGSHPRQILMTKEELEEMKEKTKGMDQ